MSYKFSRRDHDDPDREWRERLDRIEDMLAFLINYTTEMMAMITPKVQEALDKIRETQSLVKSVRDGLALQTTQIGTLTDKVTELQAKLDAGGTIGPDDLAAVAEISSDIDTVNQDLRTAIPANTGSGTGTGGGGGGGGGTLPDTPPDTSGTATTPTDPATGGTAAEADAAAAAKAQPL